MQLSVSLIVPVFNDALSLRHFRNRLLEGELMEIVDEVILVDDGSTDGSWNLCVEFCEADTRIRAVRHNFNRGLGAAIRTGVVNSRFDTVTWIPSDLQIDPDDLAAAIRCRSRDEMLFLLRRGRNEMSRNLLSGAAHLVLRLLFRVNLTNHCGIFVLPKATYLENQPITSRAISCMELFVRLSALGGRIRTTEVKCHPRRSGVSKTFSFRSAFRSIRELTGLLLIDPDLTRKKQSITNSQNF